MSDLTTNITLISIMEICFSQIQDVEISGNSVHCSNCVNEYNILEEIKLFLIIINVQSHCKEMRYY